MTDTVDPAEVLIVPVQIIQFSFVVAQVALGAIKLVVAAVAAEIPLRVQLHELVTVVTVVAARQTYPRALFRIIFGLRDAS